MKNVVSTNLREDGTLQIFVGNALLAEISDGVNEEWFIEDVINGLGYQWNSDGTLMSIDEED